MVESQPSKLLVAGSIPVSRSHLRSRETRASFGWQANQMAVRVGNSVAGLPAKRKWREAVAPHASDGWRAKDDGQLRSGNKR